MPPNFPRQNQAVVLYSAARAPTVSPTGLSPYPQWQEAPPATSTVGLSSPLRLPWVGPLGVGPPAAEPVTPHPHRLIAGGFGLGSPPFGRPYSGDPILVSLPPPTKMFPFGGFPLGTPRLPGFPERRGLSPRQEVPFGDPGFYGCLRLPRAYRRLPRPSSAPEPSHPPSGLVPTSWAGWYRLADLYTALTDRAIHLGERPPRLHRGLPRHSRRLNHTPLGGR